MALQSIPHCPRYAYSENSGSIVNRETGRALKTYLDAKGVYYVNAKDENGLPVRVLLEHWAVGPAYPKQPSEVGASELGDLNSYGEVRPIPGCEEFYSTTKAGTLQGTSGST